MLPFKRPFFKSFNTQFRYNKWLSWNIPFFGKFLVGDRFYLYPDFLYKEWSKGKYPNIVVTFSFNWIHHQHGQKNWIRHQRHLGQKNVKITELIAYLGPDNCWWLNIELIQSHPRRLAQYHFLQILSWSAENAKCLDASERLLPLTDF